MTGWLIIEASLELVVAVRLADVVVDIDCEHEVGNSCEADGVITWLADAETEGSDVAIFETLCEFVNCCDAVIACVLDGLGERTLLSVALFVADTEFVGGRDGEGVRDTVVD